MWAALPACLHGHLAPFLTPREWVNWVNACREFQPLRLQDYIPNNHSFAEAQFFSHVLDKRSNVLLHGPAGSGKTFVLRRLVRECARLRIQRAQVNAKNPSRTRQPPDFRLQMTATTGISSLHLPDARTIHSFSGIRRHEGSLSDFQREWVEPGADASKRRFFSQKAWKSVDILVIDEVSMLGRNFLEKLDWVARWGRTPTWKFDTHGTVLDKPFGGVQVILVGDFLQLAPVHDDYAFLSPVWGSLNLHTIVFDFPFRHWKDRAYCRLLQRVRVGRPLPSDLEALAEQRRPIDMKDVWTKLRANRDADATHFVTPMLSARRAQVMTINTRLLNFMKAGENHEPHMVSCEERFVRKLTHVDIVEWVRTRPPPKTLLTHAKRKQYNYVLPDKIELIHGAQYFLTHNILHLGLANGMCCVYQETGRDETQDGTLWFSPAQVFPLNSLFLVKKRFHVGANIYVERCQYALRMGYAATIHASQGMTLDAAIMNVGRSIFAACQAYVALSRVRELKALQLIQFEPACVTLKNHHTKAVLEMEREGLGRKGVIRPGRTKRKCVKRDKKRKKRKLVQSLLPC